MCHGKERTDIGLRFWVFVRKTGILSARILLYYKQRPSKEVDCGKMGVLFDIQRYSSHDGPGIRSTVFFKGCGLRCLWCHNPESFRPDKDLMYVPEACIGCGLCEQACASGAHVFDPAHRLDRSLCVRCGACAAACPAEALTCTGKEYTVGEVWEVLERDVPFYRSSGGGVTLSGGEVLLQPGFARDLLRRCREEGLHTAVDTAGFVPWTAFEDVLPFTDLFLYDVKAVTPEIHRQGTGRDNALILENYVRLIRSGARVWVRVPVVPGYSASVDEIRNIAEFLRENEPECVELLTFHRMAESKYRSLGMTYAMGDTKPPSAEEMEGYRAEMEKILDCEIRIG